MFWERPIAVIGRPMIRRPRRSALLPTTVRSWRCSASPSTNCRLMIDSIQTLLCLLSMKGLLFLLNFWRTPTGCGSAPRMGPVIDLVRLALTRLIDSGELLSMSLGLPHNRNLRRQHR